MTGLKMMQAAGAALLLSWLVVKVGGEPAADALLLLGACGLVACRVLQRLQAGRVARRVVAGRLRRFCSGLGATARK